MIAIITLDVNMFFISIHSTLYKHLLLLQTRYADGKLFIKLLLNGNQIPYSFTAVQHTASYITAYATHKLGCLNVFRGCLHFISQSVCLETLLLGWTQQICDGVYYLTKHVILEVWAIMFEIIHCVLIQNRFFKTSFTCPWYTYTVCHIHYTLLFTHDRKL
jgi:hypothetical protein